MQTFVGGFPDSTGFATCIEDIWVGGRDVNGIKIGLPGYFGEAVCVEGLFGPEEAPVSGLASVLGLRSKGAKGGFFFGCFRNAGFFYGTIGLYKRARPVHPMFEILGVGVFFKSLIFKILGIRFLDLKNIGVFCCQHFHPFGRIGAEVWKCWFLLGEEEAWQGKKQE